MSLLQVMMATGEKRGAEGTSHASAAQAADDDIQVCVCMCVCVCGKVVSACALKTVITELIKCHLAEMCG